jgi:hypothetical protein
MNANLMNPPKFFGGLFKPREDAAGLFQPSNQTFHNVPPPITPVFKGGYKTSAPRAESR